MGVDCHHMYHARKNSYLSMPLCRSCHTEYHAVEHKVFANMHNLDLDKEIINLLAEYVDMVSGIPRNRKLY